MEEMRRYIKYREHVRYVELRCNDLRNKICKQACTHGTVDQVNRKLYMKYNKYLRILKPQWMGASKRDFQELIQSYYSEETWNMIYETLYDISPIDIE